MNKDVHSLAVNLPFFQDFIQHFGDVHSSVRIWKMLGGEGVYLLLHLVGINEVGRQANEGGVARVGPNVCGETDVSSLRYLTFNQRSIKFHNL